MTVAAVELPPADKVYRSAAILALIPDETARYWARVTGRADINGAVVNVYDPACCDWLGCHDAPADDLPSGPSRFCGTHRASHGRRLRRQLEHAARQSRARRADLLASLRQIVDTSGS